MDVIIASDGVPSKASGLDDKLEDWQRMVDIDFSCVYYCARVAGQTFRKQGHGNLNFTASMSGHAVNVPQQQASQSYFILCSKEQYLTISRLVTMLARQESFFWQNHWLSSGLHSLVSILLVLATLVRPSVEIVLSR